MQKLYIKHLGPIEECEINIEEFMEWFADDFNNKEAIIEQGTEKLIRGSLKASGNEEFIRIEQLNLRRCRE